MNEDTGITPEISGLLGVPIWTSASAILLLLALSAFFSGSETALTSASRGKLRAQADQGDRAAARALSITDDRERLIGAVLLGNNLVNILAAALATSLFTRMFGDSGVAYATLTMTLLILIFAEVLPKTYSISNPESAARRVSGLIAIAVTLFFPIVSVIQFCVEKLLWPFGVRKRQDDELQEVHEEIAGTIALGVLSGAVRKDFRDRLLGILDLGNRTVRDVMLHRSEIETVDVDTSAEELFGLYTRSSRSRLPVYKTDSENIVGVLHAKDLLESICKSLQESREDFRRIKVGELMAAPYFVPETTTLDEQLQQFLSRHSHFALVVDEYGALQGIVTLEDILEEIVGDIVDEHDEPPDEHGTELYQALPDGSHVVNGAAPIRDLNRQFEWKLPDDTATTIAGLLIHEVQIIPEESQVFIFHGFRFEVVERKAQRITRIKLKKI